MVDKLEILILTSSFPRHTGDLSGNFILELASRLMGHFRVTIICPHSSNAQIKQNIHGIDIIRFPYFVPLRFQRLYETGGISYNFKTSYLAKLQLPIFCIIELISTLWIIRTKKIAIINSHWLLPQGFVGALCSKIFGISHFVSVHGSDIQFIMDNSLGKVLFNYIASNSTLIVANSNYTKDRILALNSRYLDKIRVIPMGVDTHHFSKYYPRKCNPRDGEHTHTIILTVGRLVEIKGIQYLIRSMEYVTRRMPGAVLMIVGDGPERNNLVQLTKTLGLDDNVIFVGDVKNTQMSEYYRSADVFVLPSIILNGQSEALGVVLIEAMASGVPVIGTNTGGIPDIISDGVNGLLAPERDSANLAEKICRILSDPNLAECLAREGLNTVCDKFSWDRVAQDYLKVYDYCMGNRDHNVGCHPRDSNF